MKTSMKDKVEEQSKQDKVTDHSPSIDWVSVVRWRALIFIIFIIVGGLISLWEHYA